MNTTKRATFVHTMQQDRNEKKKQNYVKHKRSPNLYVEIIIRQLNFCKNSYTKHTCLWTFFPALAICCTWYVHIVQVCEYFTIYLLLFVGESILAMNY